MRTTTITPIVMDKTGTSLVPAAARLRVAAVQMVFAASIEENLRTIGRMAAHLAKDGVDVVLFPECATTGYAGSFDRLDPGELRSAAATLSALAAQHRIHLLVGSPVLVGRRRHNALLVFDRRGRLVHAYAKCQLTERDRQWFTPGDCLSLFPLAPCSRSTGWRPHRSSVMSGGIPNWSGSP